MSSLAIANLSIELILLATEHAAWDDRDTQMRTSEAAIHRWYHWVASLCTICRVFKPAMARILYTLVLVHPGNVDAVMRVAEMDTHPFRRARAVYFVPRFINSTEMEVSVLSATFQHVHACTGQLDDLRTLFAERIHSHDLRPLSVHFMESWYDYNFTNFTIPAERLHNAFCWRNPIGSDDVTRFHTRYLILDVDHAEIGTAMDNLSQMLTVQTVKRILVRPLLPWNRSGVQAVRDAFRSFAETTRSAIIWFDDYSPTYASAEMTLAELYSYRDLYDAMTGDDLWLRGSQLYVPGPDA